MFSKRRALASIVVGVMLSPVMTGQGLAAVVKAPGAPETPQAKPTAKPVAGSLTAAQIVERHVAARGGVQAWKAVQALQLSGKLEAGQGDSYKRSMGFVHSSNKVQAKQQAAAAASGETKDADDQVQLPFTLDMKRPHMSRMEVVFAGRTAVQVYDGTHGWKLRPFLNRNDVEPFTAEETRSTEAAREDLEGPLVDYAAKGTKVELEKVERVGGSNAYKLKLTLQGGATRHVWIDAQSFLDVKFDGVPRRMDGKMHDVLVYQTDFRKIDGVMIPFRVETAVAGYPETHKMIIEKATVNPKLDDALFAKPRA
jgi:outer membrane lipoprotein-sorting protein